MEIKNIFLGLAVVALLVVYSFVYAQTERLVLTTYYPSPMGSYSELQLVPRAPGNCLAANDEGTMFYDSALHSMRVCKNVGGGVFEWRDSGNWTVSNDNTKIYLNNKNWNVGIGTENPQKKLEVNGDVKVTNLEVNGNVKVTGKVLMGWEKVEGSRDAGEHGGDCRLVLSCGKGKKVLGNGRCWTNGKMWSDEPLPDDSGWNCTCNGDFIGHRSVWGRVYCASIDN